MAATNSGTPWKTPRRTRLQVRSRKKRSIMLSQDALVGVKCMWKRLCRPSRHRLQLRLRVLRGRQPEEDSFSGATPG